MAAIEVEYSEILAYPAEVVFAALADLGARKIWQSDIVDIRVDSAGPAKVGTRVYEARNIKGHKTEANLVVSVCEPNRGLVLETVDGAKQPGSDQYIIEDLANGTCRLYCRTKLDGVPKMAQYFVRQNLTKLLPGYVHQLALLIKNRA